MKSLSVALAIVVGLTDGFGSIVGPGIPWEAIDRHDAGTFQSRNANHPLRNPYAYYIGVLDHQWIASFLGSNEDLSLISHYPNQFQAYDGWYLRNPAGNFFSVESYWEYPYSNSFSFTVPYVEGLQYTITIQGTFVTEISEWSEVVEIVADGLRMVPGGTKVDSLHDFGGMNSYNLSPGHYAINQTSGGRSGQGISRYWVYATPVPEPAAMVVYIALIAGIAVGLQKIRIRR